MNVDVQNFSAITGLVTTFTRGNKFFELVNHLGNVLATVSDRKLQVSLDGIFVGYYLPDMVMANDYYPFGSFMPGRKFAGGGVGYRYGFNGKEKSDEVYGDGNVYDYGFRIYNPRLGRFLSIDPLFKSYPHYTPYQFSGNKPIRFIDLDGREEADPMYYQIDKDDPVLAAEQALSPQNVWNGAVDGLGNLLLSGYEYSVTDNQEGKLIRYGFGKMGVNIGDDITNKALGQMFKVRKSDRQMTVETDDGSWYEELLGLGGSALNILNILSPGKGGTAFLAKTPALATTLGQIYKMTGKNTLNAAGLKLFNVVKNFDNVVYQVDKNTNLMLDKAGITHILGRHHPEYMLGEAKKVQSFFGAKTSVDDIVGKIKGITSKYGSKIEDLMKGKVKDAKGNVTYSADFQYNGKTFQLGLDPSNTSRIGQFFEKTS